MNSGFDSEQFRNQKLIHIAEVTKFADVNSYPDYPRDQLDIGIAHLGMGNFHRAHQALFMQRLLIDQPQDWMIHGIGTLANDLPLITNLRSQDYQYSLTERSKNNDTLHIIGSIKSASHAPSESETTLDALALPSVKIISLTVTEKGYGNTASGELDLSNPALLHDLSNTTKPVSTLGFLYAAAQRRKSERGEPVTVMSCDNVRGNGNQTRRLLLEFAGLKADPSVTQWIEDNMTFPNSMVDRITPAVTEQTVRFVLDRFGIEDSSPVVSEDFIQWVLEDNFIKGRPELESVGVQFVSDVEPYESLKTRMLNGTHFALAYTAYLMGYRNVEDAMRDELLYDYLTKYMDEDVTPSLPDVPGIEVNDYKQTLLKRFSNPAINDQIQRLAKDGTPKIQTFIMPALSDQLEAGGSTKWISFALASWFRYQCGVDEQHKRIDIDDPLAMHSIDLNAQSLDPTLVEKILGLDVARNERFMAELNETFNAIRTNGMRSALRSRFGLQKS